MRCRRDTACRVRAFRVSPSPSATALLVPLAKEGQFLVCMRFWADTTTRDFTALTLAPSGVDRWFRMTNRACHTERNVV